jgi:hypothetical protein
MEAAMNKYLAQFNPFAGRQRHWYEKYFNKNSSLLPVLGAIGLGAGLMYILDPDRGRGRRTFARDKVMSAFNRTGRAISEKSRDLSNRAYGLAAETGAFFRRDKESPES